MEDGYNEDIFNCYPYRGIKADIQYGMRSVLELRKEHIEIACRGPINGFKVLLHTPDEMPQMTQKFLRAPLDEDVMVLINPTIIKTSTNLRSYAPYM